MKRFLFVTANKNEKEAFEKKFKSEQDKYIKGKRYKIGKFGAYNAAYIHMDEQGIENPASIPLVAELVSELKPIGVIMVGIVFGVDRKSQKIGDVLVSKTILNYDSRKVSEEYTKYKETPKEVGFQFLNAFGDSEGWTYNINETYKSKVYTGAVLTGSALIDNYKFREQLLKDFEVYEPIGGEMEAYGIYSMCRFHGVAEWIIIKGICDWACEKENDDKEANQKIAAGAAVDFCYHVFKNRDVFVDLIGKDFPLHDILVNDLKMSQENLRKIFLLENVMKMSPEYSEEYSEIKEYKRIQKMCENNIVKKEYYEKMPFKWRFWVQLETLARNFSILSIVNLIIAYYRQIVDNILITIGILVGFLLYNFYLKRHENIYKWNKWKISVYYMDCLGYILVKWTYLVITGIVVFCFYLFGFVSDLAPWSVNFLFSAASFGVISIVTMSLARWSHGKINKKLINDDYRHEINSLENESLLSEVKKIISTQYIDMFVIQKLTDIAEKNEHMINIEEVTNAYKFAN